MIPHQTAAIRIAGNIVSLVLYATGLAYILNLPGNWKLIGMAPIVGAAVLFKLIHQQKNGNGGW